MLETVLYSTNVVAAGGFSLSGGTIGDWIKDNVLYVLLVVAVGSIIIAAITKKPRDGMVTFAIAMLAFGLLAIATNIDDITSWFKSTFFGG